ncbi:hypothetical protein O9K51_09745 [Purpureocillium lavendulum]|uniref:Uncharacterized protein n=1 Tax=Purpureocillium lavendulum TaxID=1247861 RepID=A0AB34FFT3_9HYPO|nr:hypothetical protein O9K51_09745 [Purpureocillium lavendulum]
MKRKSTTIRGRFSQYLNRARPPSGSSVDFELRALDGDDTAVQLRRLPPKLGPVSPQQRIAELTEEIRQLTCELKYYQTLTDQVLLRIMPVVHLHSSSLFALVQKCNARIEQARAEQGYSERINHMGSSDGRQRG